jgi:hypothetical protein
MSRNEALQALNSCFFDKHLTERKAVALWKEYRERVENLEPRNLLRPQVMPLNEAEQRAAENHTARLMGNPNGQYLQEIIKIHPGDLVAKQFQVVTERCDIYANEMENEERRINHCLGVGLNFKGQLVPRNLGPRRVLIDLPHFEFLVEPSGNGLSIRERDRYITAVPVAERLVLWAGYHRTYTLLCQLAGDAAGGAPLLTVMTGIPDVERFFAKPSAARDTVLGDRPALLRDFLDENLFITVNLRKRRAVAFMENIRPGKIRYGVNLVNDDS